MSDLAVFQSRIPAMSGRALDQVRALEAAVAKVPQTGIPTSHVFHAGVYARTIVVPAGVVITGALIKCSTLLIINGHCLVYVGDESVEFIGYNVIPASAGRKQAFVALSDTNLTMIFSSGAKSVEEAESEFTDEAENLASRLSTAVNAIIVTGE